MADVIATAVKFGALTLAQAKKVAQNGIQEIKIRHKNITKADQYNFFFGHI